MFKKIKARYAKVAAMLDSLNNLEDWKSTMQCEISDTVEEEIGGQMQSVEREIENNIEHRIEQRVSDCMREESYDAMEAFLDTQEFEQALVDFCDTTGFESAVASIVAIKIDEAIKTERALQASIKHWEKNADPETPMGEIELGTSSCALCQRFVVEKSSCDGCPVKEKTGCEHCIMSPYKGAGIAYGNWELGNGSQEEFIEAAQAEVEFLKSL